MLALVFPVAFVLVQAAETKFALPPETSKLKPGAGAEIVTAQCLICHSADYIGTQPRLAAPAWKGIVVKMQQKYGSPLSTNQMDSVVEYLVKNYGDDSKK